VRQLFAFGFLEMDEPALDPRPFVDVESADRKERSLVTS